MNYRHAFHAGNFADVHKHAALALVLRHLCEKPAPFRVIDTHAGDGLYDLSSAEAQRTGEWRDGIGRLCARPLSEDVAALLSPYLSVVDALNPAGTVARYPGSPRIATALMRASDRLIACEVHPDAATALAAALGRDRRVKAIPIDGWTALSANVPPRERRGLVLVDPPFEQPGEFERLFAGLAGAHRKWPTGILMAWYPIKDRPSVERFLARFVSAAIPKVLRTELAVDGVGRDAPLAASGLVVVNPPWRLKTELETVLPELAALLARGSGAGWSAAMLTDER